MPEPSLFRHYQIVQDADGSNVELIRNADQVAVLAFDTRRQVFVHCHVLLEPLADRASFEETCLRLQTHGHPLLARLLDQGEDEGNPFYITANVDGETLRAYLARQQEIPGWLAVMIASRAVESVTALVEEADCLPEDVLQALRIVQTGSQQVQIQLSDYRLVPGARGKSVHQAFDKSARMLRSFFQEQSGGGPTLPDQALPGADFTEVLSACLAAANRGHVPALKELKAALQKLAPEHLTGEIPTAHKPRALLASHLATYQDVARGVVNLVRIQSQRLDMANPYSMRGTLTKTGRTVLVEQVPPSRLVGSTVRELDDKAYAVSRKSDFPGLVSVVLVHEGEEITCLAEELAEGVSLADLLRERRALSANEAYLVLAGLDSSLGSLENSGLIAQRLRLEDIFLLTGFPREDARTTKLLLTKLTEWPSFTLMVRAHPTLSSMAGRGVDPAVLLPPDKASKGAFVPTWNGAWLSAVGRFLMGLEPIPGIVAESSGVARERESISRLFDEEILRARDGKVSPRSEFLARYVRILQHHDLVKTGPAPKSEPLVSLQPKAPAPAPSKTRSISADPASKNLPVESGPIALTSGFAPQTEKPTIGFAELLFRDTSVTESGGPHDWAKTAADAPPTIHPREVLLPPSGFVPLWLRAAVFIGGSILAGAVAAHLSGGAIWQKLPVTKAVPVMESGSSAGVRPATPNFVPPPSPTPAPSASVPKAIPVSPAPASAAPEVSIPTLPPDSATPISGGLLQPPGPAMRRE